MTLNAPTPILISLIAFVFILPGCYSVRKTLEKSQPNVTKIEWPPAYAPEKAGFFVHNEIDIRASPETVWNTLIQADAWESYYKGARQVRLKDPSDGRLSATSVFQWKTMGLHFTSTIKAFEPPYRLSWESVKKSIRGYHAWLILPSAEGCTLVTSEAQHGFLTFPQKIFIPRKLSKLHDEWLYQIKMRAETAEP